MASGRDPRARKGRLTTGDFGRERCSRPAELSLAVALPAFVQRRRHAAACEDLAHVHQRAHVEQLLWWGRCSTPSV